MLDLEFETVVEALSREILRKIRLGRQHCCVVGALCHGGSF